MGVLQGVFSSQNINASIHMIRLCIALIYTTKTQLVNFKSLKQTCVEESSKSLPASACAADRRI
jgi:hypothetical protein